MTKFVEHRSERRTATKPIVVLYHAECSDGFGAAWGAWRHFGSDAEYIAVEHQSPIPDGLQDKEIYLLDFTYPEKIVRKLMDENKRVTAIDHHVSVADVTRMTQDGVYDNDHSGAMLTWMYFHSDTPAPFLIKVIEDHDLHRFAIPETEDLFDWMELFDFEFKVFDRIAEELEKPETLQAALEKGRFIRRYREKMIERFVVNSSYEVELEGRTVGAINTELYHSETATALAEKYGVGIAWRVRPRGVYVSLRSRGEVDVSIIAVHYGGGGHAKSAGFVVRSPEDLPFKRKNDE